MNPDELLRIANRLAEGTFLADRDYPLQTELCRSVSATYYALFHTLCRCSADSLAGTDGRINIVQNGIEFTEHWTTD